MYTDHPKGHISFATTHSKEPFKEIEVPKLHAHGETVTQMLWPDHCVQETHGCRIERELQDRLDALGTDKVKYIRKVAAVVLDAARELTTNDAGDTQRRGRLLGFF